MTDDPSPPALDDRLIRLIQLFRQFGSITGDIQQDITLKLLDDPRVMRAFQEQSRWSEEKCQQKVDKAVRDFIGVMPIATLMGENLFMKTAAMHSTICDDPDMHTVISAINELLEETD